MKYSCTKDPSFASAGKHGVLREFSFFDKVRFMDFITFLISCFLSFTLLWHFYLITLINLLGPPPFQKPGSVRELSALHRAVQPGSGFWSRAAPAGHTFPGVRRTFTNGSVFSKCRIPQQEKAGIWWNCATAGVSLQLGLPELTCPSPTGSFLSCTRSSSPFWGTKSCVMACRGCRTATWRGVEAGRWIMPPASGWGPAIERCQRPTSSPNAAGAQPYAKRYHNLWGLERCCFLWFWGGGFSAPWPRYDASRFKEGLELQNVSVQD